MYEITTEPHRKLVDLKLIGKLTREQVAQLYRDEHRAILEMGCRPGDHLCIVDLTACSLQLQEVAQAFQSEIKSHGGARRLAIFTGAALARMQARRIARERADVAISETRHEVEAWLFDESTQHAA